MSRQIPGISNEKCDRLRRVFSNHHQIEKVILYGSRALNSHRTYSDIDITLIGEDITLDVINKVSQAIDNLNLPYLFDVSAYQQISNADLKDHIERVGLEIYNRSREQKLS